MPLPPPNLETYRIGVRDPKNGERNIAVVPVLNECVATSGDYERYVVIEGKRYTHIINPKTGRPVSGTLSATVITPRGVDSDALSTSLFINGPAFAEKIPEARTFLIDSEGKVHMHVPSGALFQLLPSSDL